MGKWRAALALIVVVTGCNYGAPAFSCTDDGQCGASGKCEVAHGNFCSFPDATCPGGRRFGDLSSGQANQCVGEDPPPVDAALDAPPDVPPDARTCFGGPFLTMCLKSPPTGQLMLSSATPINTDTSPMCALVESGGNYCVISGNTITVELRLRATGTRPLMLLASDTITLRATIDVGSHRGTPEIGAGANPAGCAAATVPGNGGGGAGGSFLGIGGAGGIGGSAVGGSAGGTAGPVVNNLAVLRGGCSGQDGGGTAGSGGRGGGAVYLIAGNKIELGGGINATGEGGAGGAGNASGGGGGGAGGMIGFDAPMITTTGTILLLATGGGGAEGSDSGPNTPGDPGSDPTNTNAAPGGTGNTPRGGDGGAGSVAPATAAGGGAAGDVSGSNHGGGGGGGGGAGLIKGPAASLGPMVAPAATP